MFRKAGPQTLGQYCASYSLFHDVAPETLRQYSISVSLFERWAGAPVPLTELDAESVSAWLRDYAATGVAAHTVKSKRCHILTMWRQASDEGLCDLPARRVRPVRVGWVPPTAWTVEEVQQLANTCAKLPRGHACGLRRSLWWELAVRIAWDSGLRLGDQLRLQVSQVSANGLITLSQHKTRYGHIGQLSPATMALLRHTLELVPRQLCTPWDGSGETFRRQVKLLVKKSGIRPGTWKWLRKASASDVERHHPGQGSRHLGHMPGSRIGPRHYFDPTIVQQQLAVPTPLAPSPTCPGQ
jgi:integrase